MNTFIRQSLTTAANNVHLIRMTTTSVSAAIFQVNPGYPSPLDLFSNPPLVLEENLWE